MANTGRRRPAQNAHTSNHINFGHFGTATYDSDTRQWVFLRRDRPDRTDARENDATASPVRLVRPPLLVLPPFHSSVEFANAQSKTSVNLLIKTLPDAACANEELKHNGLLHLRSSTESIHRSSLLAFGNALVMGAHDVQSGHHTAPLLAFMSPTRPDRLTLSLLDREIVEVDAQAHYRAHLPCISDLDHVQWVSQNGSISQIQFSSRASPQTGTWLAVRQDSATSILQPLLRHQASSSMNRSLLDANLVIEIPISRTGGLSHSDVAFHPANSRQIAVVDIGGNWSIWRLRGTRSRSARILYRIQLVAQGSYASDPADLQQFDGWHRIAWLASDGPDPDCVLVTNRRSTALFGMNGSMKSEVNVQIGSRKQEWIVDVAPALSTSDVFVLTTSHLFIIGATTTLKSKLHSKQIEQIVALMTWNHYRSHDDDTLKLYQLNFTHVTLLFLTSANSHVVVVYECHRVADDETPYSISDPLLLDIATANEKGGEWLSLQGVASEPTGQHLHIDNSHLFKVFTGSTDGAMYETLYQIHMPHLSPTETVKDFITLPKKNVSHHKSAHRISHSDSEDEIDDFVVADHGSVNDLDSFDEARSMMRQQLSSKREMFNEPHRLETCDLQRTYSWVTSQLLSNKPAVESNFNKILSNAATRFRDVLKVQTLWQLIQDSIAAAIHTADIERDSQTLADWVDSISTGASDGSHRYSCETVGKEGTLLEIYQELVDLWMSTLPSSTPDRLRVQRERFIRQVALDVYLSGILVKPTVETSLDDGQPQPSDQEDPMDALDQVEHFVDDSISTLPSSPAVISNGGDMPADEKQSMLSLYADYWKPQRTSEQTFSIINDLLAHLPTSSSIDPSTYNHNDIELSLAIARNEQLNQTLDSRTRRKKEKLERARQRQLDRQAQTRRAALEQSAAPPTVVQSSQLAQSSQPGVEDMPSVSMTQPERGVHGTRDGKRPKAKGKGGRQKGF